MLKKKIIRDVKVIILFTIVTVLYIVSDVKKMEEEATEILSTPVFLEVEDVSCSDSKPSIIDSELIEIDLEDPYQEDYELLCKVTHAESSGTEELETIAIAATVLNRMEDSEFPDEIEDVIFAEGQFSTAEDGEIKWYPLANQKETLLFEDVSEETQDAVNAAMDGEDPTECIGGALYFYSDKYLPDYKKPKVKDSVKYGDTVFYRELA